MSDRLDGLEDPSKSSTKRQRTEGASTEGVSTEGASGPNGQHELVQMRAPPATPRPKLLAAGALGLYGFCAIDLCHYAFTPKPKVSSSLTPAPPPLIPSPSVTVTTVTRLEVLTCFFRISFCILLHVLTKNGHRNPDR